MSHRLWRKKPIILAVVIISTLCLVLVHRDLTYRDDKHSATVPRRNLSSHNKPESGISNRLDANSHGLHRIEFKQTVVNLNDNNQPQYGIFESQRGDIPVRDNKFGIVDSNRQFGGDDGHNRYGNDAQIKRVVLQPPDRRPADEGDNRRIKYIPDLRFVHLDLKGAPPKISYFRQIFPLLKEAGANGILLEYEDMFSFE